jgi:HSP20 family protein
MNLRQMMDRLFENAWIRPGRFGDMGDHEATLALDVHETDDELVVMTAVPGVRPEDIDVTVQGDILRIQGEIRPRQDVKEHQVYRQERRFGRFSRELVLPVSVRSDAIRADYENGILTLHMPKAEEAKPRRIQVRSGGSSPQIEGRAA